MHLGAFSPVEITTDKLLLLTAGGGITPVASMLHTLASLGADTDIALLHYARSPEGVISGREIDLLARQMPRTRVISVFMRWDA